MSCWTESSLSRNALIPIHNSLFSISLSILLGSLLLILSSLLHSISFFLIVSSLFRTLVMISILFIGALWLNDLILESNIGGLTLHELSSISFAFGLFILSEFMLFFAAFWCYFNLMILSSIFIFFSFPPFYIIPIYPFALPFSNLLILLFSSLPIQSAILFLKTGLHLQSIEGLGQNIACGFLFLLIQFQEYIYAYFNISYSIYGSIFYFTTGLHGLHVFIGTLLILIILLLFNFSSFYFFIELHNSFQLWCNYWHFVDCLWFCVFFLFYFRQFT